MTSKLIKKLLVGLLIVAMLFTVSCSDQNNKTEASSEATTVSSSGADTEKEKANSSSSESSEKDVADAGNSASNEDAANSSSDNSEADLSNSTDKNIEDFEVTEYEEAITMYAVGAVNVRSGPGTTYDVVGGLKVGQEVETTGECDNNWKQITYNNEIAYVSGKYLDTELPTISEPEQSTNDTVATETQQNTQVAQVEPHAAGIIFVGDSRTVQMHEAVGDDGNVWICQNSKGYAWLEATAIERINNNVGQGTKIIINLGVNDPGNWKNYAELINSYLPSWTQAGATVYYALVGPVWENPYTTDEQVKVFNSSILGVLDPSVHILDEYNFLVNNGYRLVDGLHYDAATYQAIYSFYLSSVG